ncbi:MULTISPECIES: PilZ domain-containing protein [Sphingomonadaceae]|uniref:PilZ domain-containing protein n=1 Tax=Novosphingobium clariflavum TaxID=2029884 RepID=A0ABV6S6C7_9SPHN|nr:MULTISPECIES: PilZ domain-containing protein [Sphingomonadaceae]QDK31992.1 pilus assembly protein PilZ [Sphingomonas sp. IC081]QSR15778.1 pilus assembly protein PilZ [Novosphingobium sp. KA1]
MIRTQPPQRYEVAAQEDRSAPRVRIAIPAGFRASGTKGYQTAVRDLSLSGFSATAISRLHPGTYCWLTLPGMESLPSRVVWWQDGLVGCSFEQLLSPIILETILARWSGSGS